MALLEWAVLIELGIGYVKTIDLFLEERVICLVLAKGEAEAIGWVSKFSGLKFHLKITPYQWVIETGNLRYPSCFF